MHAPTTPPLRLLALARALTDGEVSARDVLPELAQIRRDYPYLFNPPDCSPTARACLLALALDMIRTTQPQPNPAHPLTWTPDTDPATAPAPAPRQTAPPAADPIAALCHAVIAWEEPGQRQQTKVSATIAALAADVLTPAGAAPYHPHVAALPADVADLATDLRHYFYHDRALYRATRKAIADRARAILAAPQPATAPPPADPIAALCQGVIAWGQTDAPRAPIELFTLAATIEHAQPPYSAEVYDLALEVKYRRSHSALPETRATLANAARAILIARATVAPVH